MVQVVEKAKAVLEAQALLDAPGAPALLMVSGGSDSAALAYVAAELRAAGEFLQGPCAIFHLNHMLRGADADEDAVFVEQLAALLGLPFVGMAVDVAALAREERGNVEAVARRERYAAANNALADLCRRAGVPVSEGRLLVAHTADDRVENFFMRSIVGTGPGGFRSMRYLNGLVARPLLECGRQELRDYLEERAAAGLPVARDAQGALWREDATNEHTDRFRAYVRANLVPPAKERNPQLLETLTRSMNLIAAEDDMLEAVVDDWEQRYVVHLVGEGGSACDGASSDGGVGAESDQAPEAGYLLSPDLCGKPVPLLRRLCHRVLKRLLGFEERVDAASVEAVLAAFGPTRPNGGYVCNIQGNLAVSANKLGVRVEPMACFRLRRGRVK